MNLDKELTRLQSTYNERGFPTDKTIEHLDELIRNNQKNAKLWVVRGDLIQLSEDEDSKYSLKDSLSSYIKASKVDPSYWESYESIGYYYDVIDSNYPLAELNFRKSISLHPTVESYEGLARVLAEQDKAIEAIELLSPHNCEFHNHEEINELRREIESGQWGTK